MRKERSTEALNEEMFSLLAESFFKSRRNILYVSRRVVEKERKKEKGEGILKHGHAETFPPF